MFKKIQSNIVQGTVRYTNEKLGFRHVLLGLCPVNTVLSHGRPGFPVVKHTEVMVLSYGGT